MPLWGQGFRPAAGLLPGVLFKVEGIMAETSWMKTRQTKFGAYAAVYVLVVIAVLCLGNWLANGHNKSVDVTANKQYTLSDQTKKVLGNLKSDINIYYFDT